MRRRCTYTSSRLVAAELASAALHARTTNAQNCPSALHTPGKSKSPQGCCSKEQAAGQASSLTTCALLLENLQLWPVKADLDCRYTAPPPCGKTVSVAGAGMNRQCRYISRLIAAELAIAALHSRTRPDTNCPSDLHSPGKSTQPHSFCNHVHHASFASLLVNKQSLLCVLKPCHMHEALSMFS